MTHKKPIYIMGTSASHNGASCLLKDGKVIVAIEKERLTEKKNDGGNDLFTMQYCLDAAGIKISDIDLIVQNDEHSSFRYGNQWYRGPRNIPEHIPVVTISHHLAHACCAFFLSPFEEATVLVVDGSGNAFEDCIDLDSAILTERPEGEMTALWFEKDSFYQARDTTVKAIYKDFSPWGRIGGDYPLYPKTTRHSIGGAYLGASRYAFTSASDLGKLMGLAPYGKPMSYETEIFTIKEGRVFINYDWISKDDKRCTGEEDFKNRFSYFADLARRVQSEVERALLTLLRNRYEYAPSANLCFAGGVALNAVANQRILQEAPYDRLFVPPAADDSGIAIGCAFYGWHTVLGQERVFHDGAPFLGRNYRKAEIEHALQSVGNDVIVQRPDDIVATTAAALEKGQVVGWFRGGSEFGPRALGHRSILADPRRAELRDYINAKIKFREDFRPFAPSVLAEDAANYFELECDSPYMLRVVPVREAWRLQIPAVTHVDGTARVQTVKPETDAVFHALLEEFKRRTGIGMLLNTSLNRRDKPIVETPRQAINLFKETGMHALVIEDFFLTKEGS